ncbi:MAG: TetR/AcrR family transcriptional regulator [Pseudomonadota bacterium]
MADKSAHKAKIRARILDEAAGAIRVQGVQGVSVADLMKRAGLTHGGFYAYFSSRDDLVAQAVDRMFEDNRAMLSRFLENSAPDLGGLIDYYLSDGAYHMIERACPIPPLAGEVSRMPGAVRDRFEQGISRFRDALAGAFEILGYPQSEALASSVLAELVGSVTLARSMAQETAALAYLEASRLRLKARLGLPG